MRLGPGLRSWREGFVLEHFSARTFGVERSSIEQSAHRRLSALFLQKLQMLLRPGRSRRQNKELEQERPTLGVPRVVSEAGTQSINCFLELSRSKEL